jgi:thiamine biosynthesis lipoprotein
MTTTAHVDWPLWSTTARLVVTDPAQLDAAVAIADDMLGAIDAACSRFRTDSELSVIAPHLASGVTVSDLLALFVRRALDAAAATKGAVDPTLGYALNAVGYDRDITLIEDNGSIVRAVVSPRPGWKNVYLIGNRLRVPAHLSLDLGATAKAFAADLVAARITNELRCGVLVSLGGDIATAGREPDEGWNIHVEDLPGDPACTIRLREHHAVATSSTQKRIWTAGGTLRHHILDPATGLPAEPVWRTVTVCAPTCLTANSLSTASIVRGESAVTWLRALGYPARLVARDGTVTTLGGWPAERTLKAVA